MTPLTVRWGRHGEAREGRRGERGVVGVGARCGGEKATLSEGVIRARAEGGEHRERFVQNAERRRAGHNEEVLRCRTQG